MWKLHEFTAVPSPRKTRPHAPCVKGRAMSDAEIRTAREQAANGWTNKKIAKYHGVSVTQIGRHCKGVKRGHPDGR